MKNYTNLSELEKDIYNHIIKCKKFDRLSQHFIGVELATIFRCSCGSEWKLTNFTISSELNFNLHWINHITSDSQLFIQMKELGQNNKTNNSISMLKINDLGSGE